jgi:hypothetical protein
MSTAELEAKQKLKLIECSICGHLGRLDDHSCKRICDKIKYYRQWIEEKGYQSWVRGLRFILLDDLILLILSYFDFMVNERRHRKLVDRTWSLRSSAIEKDMKLAFGPTLIHGQGVSVIRWINAKTIYIEIGEKKSPLHGTVVKCNCLVCNLGYEDPARHRAHQTILWSEFFSCYNKYKL